MNISAITSAGAFDRFAVYSSELLDSASGRVGSGFRLDSSNSFSTGGPQKVRSFASELGAAIERLKYENEKLLMREETPAEEDERIKNLDQAEEAIQLASYNILAQSQTGMLTQANLLPESALHLLQ